MASSSSSSSLSSSVPPQEKHEIQEQYDLFLSFRGEDTRKGFASYLYSALSANQILTFMDDHELERGDEISPTLIKAIDESKISVVIFSENYASSTWCLDELLQILECRRRNGQIVMPIFYGIDPSVVRKQEGSYEVAFAKLEKRFEDRMEKVKQWRAALTEASNLCGLDSKDFRPEHKLVQKIVEDISLKLPKYLAMDEHFKRRLIGIEKHIKEIESLLSIGTKDIRITGIWGMGGIGKTTIASAVFQRLSYFQFDSYCFLWNVREEYLRHGPNHLRKKLLSELLSDESILKMDTPFVASSFIRNKLRRKKVLIILDDLDSSIKLEALVEGYDHFALGSRIIVTTRNVQVLKKVADDIYKVEGLNEIESLELFNLHAFGKSSTKEYEMLLNHVTSCADGNPLALKVLGSFLHSKSKDEWESALNKLKTIPNKDILDVLRISYDGLDDKGVQNLFLDIACLINQSFTRDDAENMLDAGNSFVKIGLTVLIEKSLIESRKGNELWMHDLLRQVGQTIVCDENREPGNCSRLWDVRDVCHVLERNTGTAAIEGISFNMSEIKKDVKLCLAAFSEMYNLRILKIYCENIDNNKFKLHLPQDLGSYLSDKLTYLQWDLYPLKSLPSNFSPENLVELILRGSHVQKLWNHHEVQSLPILRRIDLSYSKFLTQIPDLSLAPNLESINLEGCTSLVQVLSSLQNLHKLSYLNLNGCSKLRDLKEISKSTRYLDLVRFGGIKNFLSNICQLKFTYLKSFIQSFTTNLSLYSSQSHISQKFPNNLTVLLLHGATIETLPSTIGYLSSLVQLDLSACERLKSLPSSICNLNSLESLDLGGCRQLEKFPEILEPMEHLTNLIISGTAIKELPESIENLVSLEKLVMYMCEDIEFLPNNLCNLKKLREMCLRFCSKLENLPSFPPALNILEVYDCQSLKSLPELPSSCFDVNALHCKSLEKISNWRPPLLQEMDLDNSFVYGQSSFYGCQKLDQNTRNNILADRAVTKILSCAKFKRSVDVRANIFYPGDEIPKWFSYQTFGASMNIMLPPYWNNDNFLGLSLSVVFQWNKLGHHIQVIIECKLSFKTTNDDDDCTYEFHRNRRLWGDNLSSDHVLMWYDQKLSLQDLGEKFGLSWPSSCSTEVSLHVRPIFVDRSALGKIVNLGSEYFEIKKCGIWLVNKEDIEQFDAETKSKRKRHFDEYCEASGSEVVCSHEEDDVDESHRPTINSKKFKII